MRASKTSSRRLLPNLVCASAAAATAQRDMATDWIAAYEILSTDRPLYSALDLPDSDGAPDVLADLSFSARPSKRSYIERYPNARLWSLNVNVKRNHETFRCLRLLRSDDSERVFCPANGRRARVEAGFGSAVICSPAQWW